MGKRRALMPAALLLAGLSSILGIVPLVLLWLIVRELLTPQLATPAASHLFLQKCALWAFGVAVGSVAAYFIALSLSHLAAFRVEVNIRKESVRRLIGLPLGFFDRNTIGRMRKIIDDNASITHTFLAHQLPDLVGTILAPIATVLLILFFDWRLGLATLIPILLALGTIGRLMGKNEEFMKAFMNALEEMNTEAVEYVRGIPVVKVFQQTVFSFKRFYASIMKYKEMVTTFSRLWQRPMSLYLVLIHGFAYFLIPVAILLISRGAAPLPILIDLFFFILITPVFAQSIMRSMHINQALGQAKEAVERVEQLLDEKPLSCSPTPQSVSHYDISFQGVTFTYPEGNRPAVNRVSFDLPQGKVFALVGPSGGGKTSIARLVPRFWDPQEGHVTLGGVDVSELDPKELMEEVSFVFQNNKLFKTTILENLKVGKPNATEEEIQRALELAQAKEIVERLPQGLDTRLGADGTYLSGGEQQRIALARAFLKDAPVVVLDEATAFADPENEHLIQKALNQLMRGKTVLMIAHRLSSVVGVDKILVVERGEIVESGTHEELLEREGLYSRMWNEYQQSVQWTLKEEVQYA